MWTQLVFFLECGGSTPLWNFWNPGDTLPKNPKRCPATALQKGQRATTTCSLESRAVIHQDADDQREEGCTFEQGCDNDHGTLDFGGDLRLPRHAVQCGSADAT